MSETDKFGDSSQENPESPTSDVSDEERRRKLLLEAQILMGQPHSQYLVNPLRQRRRPRREGIPMGENGIVTNASQISEMLSNITAETGGELPDRACGVMLGLAVGNLLGIPMEGRWYYEIERRYPMGVLYIDQHEKDRLMDDDLAQAVDLAEALVEGGDYLNGFVRRLVVWARENGRGMGSLTRRVIWLLDDGHHHTEAARLDYEDNRIAPNGGLMRCAPVALARFRQPELLVNDSAATCAVTHYAATCQWSCIIINAVISLLLRGAEPDLAALMRAVSADGAPDMLAVAESDGIPTEILAAVTSRTPIVADASWLRQDQRLVGHTLLAMQAGLWAAVTPLDFETALRQVVEAGGDTDTNGAVAGAVLGARYGASAIPQRWLDCIPQRERIEKLADDLLAMAR